MDRPVIILGGGIMGSLLAYRLKDALPHIPFVLYEESSTLGNHQSCSFRESDCEKSLKWLRPLIAHSWKHHHIKFPQFEKWVMNPYHLIESRKLHEVVSNALGNESLRLNNKISIEQALQIGAFVIDARNICHFKKSGYRKYLSMEVELNSEHNLIAPVILDAQVEIKDSFRSVSYLPLSSKTLLVNDFWYSENKRINTEEMRKNLNETFKSKGWKVARVLREESGVTEVPVTAPIIREEGRVLNLAGIFHDTTGCSIPSTTKLIDLMISTSFRFGELKEVIKTFRREQERDRKFLRMINKEFLVDSTILSCVYSQSYPFLERFSRGELNFVDRSRLLFRRRKVNLSGLLHLFLPYPLQFSRN